MLHSQLYAIGRYFAMIKKADKCGRVEVWANVPLRTWHNNPNQYLTRARRVTDDICRRIRAKSESRKWKALINKAKAQVGVLPKTWKPSEAEIEIMKMAFEEVYQR